MLIAKETFNILDEYFYELTPKNKEEIYKYYSLIETENQKYNLTGFYNENLLKEGIIESILIFREIQNSIFDFNRSSEILDIGSGAGFPILPYFIINPNFNLTIYEPMTKRVNFLNKVIQNLNLKNIIVKQIRAEDSSEFEKFDFISARAVSELKNLIEISHKLGKNNATFCFLKSQNYYQEINNANWIKNKLNIDFKIVNLPVFFNINNTLVYYQKKSKTPHDIPRKWATIIKDNLKK
ncbi:16S rRNA (guanine(527)-N(7))-methyltransferase RsmG [Metamycoplasma equirhinis]|uniref:16S rRNA (guanine(527)-N(7))-methyltransferase RsmG n=1 Tax=Metamycoplasma equirhinis TaxID=92402 RepID=UPI003593BAD7